jgi:hypothetical protein
MRREEFKKALQEKRWGDFVGMYRPFWNTGGEMGNWDKELMYVRPHPSSLHVFIVPIQSSPSNTLISS